jgi:hypothetical protein
LLFVTQAVSADGSLTDVYAKSAKLAEKTFEQGANVWNGKPMDSIDNQDPITGTTTVGNSNSNN